MGLCGASYGEGRHIVETLEDGPREYDIPGSGVRLKVPNGVAPSPGSVGPVLLDEMMRVVECGQKHFFVPKIVMCTSKEVEFSPPLLMEFLLHSEGSCNGGDPDITEVLRRFQVTQNEHSATHGLASFRLAGARLTLPYWSPSRFDVQGMFFLRQDYRSLATASWVP